MLAMPSGSPSLLLQEKTLADADGFVRVEKGVNIAPFERSENSDDASRYVAYLMFNRLCSLDLRCNLYSKPRSVLGCCSIS